MSTEEEILDSCKVVAVVGLSPDMTRPSYMVAEYLQQQGYRIIPVNPYVKEVLGEKSYPELSQVKECVEAVDIFRRPEEIPAIVDQAIAIKAKAVWMQLGLVDEKSAAKARQAGLKVVMNKCMRVEHSRLSFSRKNRVK